MRNWVTMIRIFRVPDYGLEMDLALQYRVPRKDKQPPTHHVQGGRPAAWASLVPLVPLVPLAKKNSRQCQKSPPFLVEEVVRIENVRRVQPRNHREGNDKDNPPERVLRIVRHVETACEHDDQESTQQLRTVMMRMVGIESL